ncbi:MAG: type VI secretion IcmF C-terminal domain-containing protein, partial [Planctomycetota bacterium]
PNFGKAIHGLFMRTMESVRRALAREATAELSGAWQPVLRDFRANVASGWPFDAQSNTDASLDRVIDMLHPASGALWNVANMATTMSGLQLGGSPLVTLTPGYVTAIGNARLLTDRLFGGENRATVPRLSGSVMLRTRSGASDIALTINGKRLELRPGRRVNFEWSADGGTCRLDADSQSVDGGNGPWALIRLLGEAESADVDTRRTQFTFHPASGMTITMILETATAGNPFKADLFSRVVLPDAICVPPVGDDE